MAQAHPGQSAESPERLACGRLPDRRVQRSALCFRLQWAKTPVNLTVPTVGDPAWAGETSRCLPDLRRASHGRTTVYPRHCSTANAVAVPGVRNRSKAEHGQRSVPGSGQSSRSTCATTLFAWISASTTSASCWPTTCTTPFRRRSHAADGGMVDGSWPTITSTVRTTLQTAALIKLTAAPQPRTCWLKPA